LDREQVLLKAIQRGTSFSIVIAGITSLSNLVLGIAFGATMYPRDMPVLFQSDQALQDYSSLWISRFLIGVISGSILGFLCGFLSSFGAFDLYQKQKTDKKTTMYCLVVALVILCLWFVLELLFYLMYFPFFTFADVYALYIPQFVWTLCIIEITCGSLWSLTTVPVRQRTYQQFHKKPVSPKKLSWKHMLFRLCIVQGCSLGSIYLLVGLIGSYPSGIRMGPTLLVLVWCITAIMAPGDLFIRQIKMKFRAVDNTLIPLINRKRLYRGCIIGFLEGAFLCTGFFLLAFQFFDGDGFNLAIVSLVQGCLGGCMIGTLFGGIYGTEMVITFHIARFSERKLGQIGLLLMLVGTIIAALPSFQ
jgi:hypothetical protein